MKKEKKKYICNVCNINIGMNKCSCCGDSICDRCTVYADDDDDQDDRMICIKCSDIPYHEQKMEQDKKSIRMKKVLVYCIMLLLSVCILPMISFAYDGGHDLSNLATNMLRLSFTGNINDTSGNRINSSYYINGIAGYDFRLNQDSNDFFGSYTSIEYNTPTYTIHGINLNGVDEWLNTTIQTTNFNYNFTICTIINPANSGAVRQHDVFGNFVGAGSGILVIIEGDNKINFYSGGSHLRAGTINIAEDNFYCIGQNTTHRWARLNNDAVVTNTPINTFSSGEPHLWIGREMSSPGRYYNGSLKYMLVYNRSLTDNEITALNNPGYYVNNKDSIPNSAINFDGLYDSVAVKNQTTLNPIDSAMTFSFWFKNNLASQHTKRMFSKRTGVNGYEISQRNDKIMILLGSGGTSDAIDVGTSNITGTQWTFVSVVMGENISTTRNVTVYVNGFYDGSYLYSRGTIESAGHLFIGSLAGTSNIYNGSIDEVNIWNYALNQSEITQLYNGYDDYDWNDASGFEPTLSSLVNITDSTGLKMFTSGVQVESGNITVQGECSGGTITYKQLNLTYANGTMINHSFEYFVMYDSSWLNDDGIYNVSLHCVNNYTSVNITRSYFILNDTNVPSCSWNSPVYPSGSTVYTNTTLSIDLTCQDLNLFSFNITCKDNLSVLKHSVYAENIVSPYQYINSTDNFTNKGTASCTAIVKDRHTAKDISQMGMYVKSYPDEKMLSFKYMTTSLNISTIENIDKLDYTLQKDRYIFDAKMKDHPSSFVYIVECDTGKLWDFYDEKYGVHVLCGDVWADFIINGIDKKDVKLVRLSENKARVTIKVPDKITSLSTHSIGIVNTLTQTAHFQVSDPEVLSVFDLSDSDSMVFLAMILIWIAILFAGFMFQEGGMILFDGLLGMVLGIIIILSGISFGMLFGIIFALFNSVLMLLGVLAIKDR